MAPSAHADTTTEGVPHFSHVFTLVLENSNYDASWGANGIPWLQQHIADGAFLENYYATGHASADNYIAMTSGQPPTPLFMGDCENWSSCVTFERTLPDHGRNIADQLEAPSTNKSWKGYMESMPANCTHPTDADTIDPYSNGYATRHNPFAYYPTIVDNPTRCGDHVVKYSELATDIHDDTVPAYAFITPDTCSDGHDNGSTPVTTCKDPKYAGLTGPQIVDKWLNANMGPIIDYVNAHDGVLFITFDENGFSDPACCEAGGGVGGHVGMLVLGQHVKPGTYSTTYDHYSFLRTVEDAYGITEHLSLAGSPGRTPIADIWSEN